MFYLNVILLLTSIVFDGTLALMVTSPSNAATWNLQMPNTITWTSVVTDPNTFDIVLVNNNPNCAPTGMSQVIQHNVSCSDGQYNMSGIAPVKPCDGYQINLEAVGGAESHSPGILAQSPPFIVAAGTQSSVTTPAPGTTPDQAASPKSGTLTPTQSLTDKTFQNGTTSPAGVYKPSMGSTGTSPLPNSNTTGGGAGDNVQSFALLITISLPKIISVIAFSASILWFQ